MTKRVSKVFFLIATLNSFLFSSFFNDASLPRIREVKRVIDRSSIGFEWKSVAMYPQVTGINVYRAKVRRGNRQEYEKIATIPNRFATHFVDTKIEPNTKYFYTFTTFSGFMESSAGDIVPVKTKPPYRQIKLLDAEVIAKDTVKILWIPSKEPQIYKYIIQRQKDNIPKWFFIDDVFGRLMPEYIDTTARRGHTYRYRVIGIDAYGMPTIASRVIKIEVR